MYMFLFFSNVVDGSFVETRCELVRFVHYYLTNILDVFFRFFFIWHLSGGTEKELLWESCGTDLVPFVGLDWVRKL